MPVPEFKAVRQGAEYSLRTIYPNSRLPGDRSSQFGRLRMERDGWNTWGEDEDFGRGLRAACHRAGRRSPLETVLAEIRKTYLRWYHPDGGWTEASAPVIDATGDYLGDVVRTHAMQ